MKSKHTNDSENFSSEITSGANIPLWFSKPKLSLAYEKLNEDVKTDVLVVGGGISGLTTAYCLTKNGKKVTFDCPIHGSRFNWDGKLLNGVTT